MNPFDVLATRMYNQNGAPAGLRSLGCAHPCTKAVSGASLALSCVFATAGALYKSPFDCFRRTVVAEGPSALLKGWTAHYLRLGPHIGTWPSCTWFATCGAGTTHDHHPVAPCR
jgi:solute carrier family 25 protein 34/35